MPGILAGIIIDYVIIVGEFSIEGNKRRYSVRGGGEGSANHLIADDKGAFSTVVRMIMKEASINIVGVGRGGVHVYFRY